MAKRKAEKYVVLPKCENVECHGYAGRGFDKQRNMIWRCVVCGRAWPREAVYS